MTKTKRDVAPRSRKKGSLGKAGAVVTSGLVPAGDVRLTANIRADLHMKLKIRAVERRTTVGELVEQWIEGWK
jgi:hypothetical protein